MTVKPVNIPGIERAKKFYTGHHLSTFYCPCGCEQFQMFVADGHNICHAGIAYSLEAAEEVILNVLVQIRTLQNLEGKTSKVVN